MFIPSWGNNSTAFYMRTRGDSAGAYNLIRGEVRALDAALPVYSMKTLEAQLDETLLTDHLIALLSAGFGLLAIGLAIGIPSAVALGRYVSSRLYGIEAHDPWIAGTTVVLLTVVSAAAGLLPARGASLIDPILALRYE